MTRAKKAAPPVGKHERSLITTIDRRKGPIAMTDIEDIKRKELTRSEQDVLDADRDRWQRLGKGAHLDEWLAFYPGLGIRRRLAMRLAYSNQPKGGPYSDALNKLYEADGIETSDKTSMKNFTDVLWLCDKPEHTTILREIREAMTPGERSRLNSPISARQRVQKEITKRTRLAKGLPATPAGSDDERPPSKLKQTEEALARALQEKHALEQKLAKSDGSLFNLKTDTAADIVATIAANVSDNRAEEIGRGLLAAVKQKKAAAAKLKHAG